MEKRPNALQAVLDRARQDESAEPTPAAPPAANAANKAAAVRGKPAAKRPRTDHPGRVNKRVIAGHFSPDVSKQLRLLAAEEETTIQALLEEAIDLLLAKKAKSRIGRRAS